MPRCLSKSTLPPHPACRQGVPALHLATRLSISPSTHQQVHHRLLLQLGVQARQQAARQLSHEAAVHLLGTACQCHVTQSLGEWVKVGKNKWG